MVEKKVDFEKELEDMSLEERLNRLRSELRVGKDLYNSYGKYKYRNAESIYQAVKPLLDKYKLFMHVTDEVTTHGSGESERFYIKATCTVWAYGFPGAVIKSCCEVREDDSKKGMDGCQISGSAYSYANKYCMGSMFLLDDSKDPDSNEAYEAREEARMEALKSEPIGAARAKVLENLLNSWGVDIEKYKKWAKVAKLEDITEEQFGWTNRNEKKVKDATA